jgi:hypothetical protein
MPAPVVTSFSSDLAGTITIFSVKQGDTFYINGTNLTTANITGIQFPLYFDRTSGGSLSLGAQFSCNAAGTQITCVVPFGAADGTIAGILYSGSSTPYITPQKLSISVGLYGVNYPLPGNAFVQAGNVIQIIGIGLNQITSVAIRPERSTGGPNITGTNLNLVSAGVVGVSDGRLDITIPPTANAGSLFLIDNDGRVYGGSFFPVNTFKDMKNIAPYVPQASDLLGSTIGVKELVSNELNGDPITVTALAPAQLLEFDFFAEAVVDVIDIKSSGLAVSPASAIARYGVSNENTPPGAGGRVGFNVNSYSFVIYYPSNSITYPNVPDSVQGVISQTASEVIGLCHPGDQNQFYYVIPPARPYKIKIDRAFNLFSFYVNDVLAYEILAPDARTFFPYASAQVYGRAPNAVTATFFKKCEESGAIVA